MQHNSIAHTGKCLVDAKTNCVSRYPNYCYLAANRMAASGVTSHVMCRQIDSSPAVTRHLTWLGLLCNMTWHCCSYEYCETQYNYVFQLNCLLTLRLEAGVTTSTVTGATCVFQTISR